MKSKLKELVKFSKWDLRNYWQLRESAQKSHRKLAKLCYDWKTALKRSVSGILAECDTKETNEAARNDPQIEFGKAEMYMKVLKKNKFLKRIFSKKRIKPDMTEMDVAEQYPWLTQHASIVYEPLDMKIDLSVGDITKLMTKMNKLQTRFYEHSHWKNRAFMQNDIESLCSSIIITTKEHANKNIPFPRKQRLLSVLLQHFKQNGVKLYAPGDIDYLLPSQLFLNQNFTAKDAMFAIKGHGFNKVIRYNYSNDKYNEWFASLTEKSQDYYQNCIRKMCQLRGRRMSIHQDIHQEGNKCYGVTERLLSSILFQRNNLDELLKQITTLQQWYINIQYEIKETKTLQTMNDSGYISSERIREFFWNIREKFTLITQCVHTLTAVYSKVISICKEKEKKQNQRQKHMANQIFDSDDLAHFEESIPDFIADEDYEDGTDCDKINDPIIQSLIHSKKYVTKEYAASLKQIKSITTKLNKYQQLFDEITAHKLSPQQYESMYHECYSPFWSLTSFTKLSSIHDGLRTIYDSLHAFPCFNNLNISVTFENVLISSEKSPADGLNKEYVKCYESVIEQIQFCIQDVIHVVTASEFNPPNPSKAYEDGDELRDNVENKYFAFQQQSFIAITKAFHGKEIAEKLHKLMHFIPNNDSKIMTESLHNLLLMIGSIIDMGRFVLNHNINCHKSFCKLEYVLTSLFNGLFVKGFCKKEEEKEEDGEQQIDNDLGDGVGMADGEGIEDVSHEMENEGQVEGLDNEQKPQQPQDKKDKQPNDEDVGVEMEQDFDGELEDIEQEQNKQNKGDDSDDDDVDDIDREMGDVDFNKSQVIDERMWGSDDEEQEDDDKNKNDQQQEQNQDENDRNKNQELNTKDEYSQVQAKLNPDEKDENEDNKPNKSDVNQEEDDEEDDKTNKEEQVARLEFGDPLEDLDENVSDEEAATEKKDVDDENKNGNEEDEERYPRKQFDLNDEMNIDFSESEDEEAQDEEMGKDENDALDLEALQKELEEKDKEREQEKMDDLQRGAGEIFPENEPKDEALEFINDGDEDGDDEEADDEEQDTMNQNEAMDIDKEGNEGEDEKNGDVLQPENDEAQDKEEETEDVNAANSGDFSKPEMPETDENKQEHDKEASDVEMEQNEDEEEQNKDEAKENEDSETEDANLQTENDTNDQQNDEAMGVYGGMGDSAPVGDDDEDDKEDDVDMKDDNKEDVEAQRSDIYGDDQEMMQQEDTKGEWQPMNQPQNKKEQKRNEEKQKEMEDKSNPFRSLGDALSEWKQRLNMIEQDENAQREEDIADDANDDDDGGNDDEQMDGDNYAHVPDDMNVDNETQALMDNEDEDMTHLPNIMDVHNDEEAFDDDENDNDPFDEQQAENMDANNSDEEDKFDPYKKQKQAQKQEEEEKKNDVDSKQNEVKLKDLTIPNDENDEETKQSYLDYIQQLFEDNDDDDDKQADDEQDADHMDINMDEMKQKQKDKDNENDDTKTDTNNNDDDEDEDDGPTAIEIAELRNTLDERLSAWHQSSSPNALQSGDEIWRKLCLVTNSLSQQLCEELRTILEPLQMTKLGGDFRSGKRINMKKVIPYIASQFRKDKIWLRRCKPHKRNYQILVCIDDSESMRENSAGRLALESMCILTRALNKLEVGSIGVLSFGQTIDLLHSLQRPFNDGCGSFVCSQFSFAQKETKYQDLVATIINVLSNNDSTWKNIKQHMQQSTGKRSSALSTSSSSSYSSVSWDGSETLSLIFIISDARIQQDRKQLEQLIRIAHERKQIVLLIIVDSNDETTSIVNVKSIHVDPVTNKVNVCNYLDEFPFPYYVLLKDIQTLPNVVADSLRQWFELVRQSS